jgi:hypothetical protein
MARCSKFFTNQGYTGEMGEGEVAPWKLAMYDIWYRDPRAVLKTSCQEIGQVVRRFAILHCHSIPLYLQ